MQGTSDAAADRLPARIGRYRILCELGRGATAVVYLARAEGRGSFERLFAIKVLREHLAEEGAFVQMFLNEARLAARIHHPNAISVYEVDVADGAHYIAMDYMSGENLAATLRLTWNRKRQFPIEMAAHILAQASEGLHAAHELRDGRGDPLRVVHRDVSPQNVMVGYDGTVRVMDFGAAKAADQVPATRPGTLKGTIAYMSPEQLRGEVIDRRSDIFSLGVLLWESTTGKRLFKGTTTQETITRVLRMTVPRPSTLRASYPLELEQVVMRALDRDAARRFDTAREFGEALGEFIARTGKRINPADLERLLKGLFGEFYQERADMERRAAAPEPPELMASLTNRHYEGTPLPSNSEALKLSELLKTGPELMTQSTRSGESSQGDRDADATDHDHSETGSNRARRGLADSLRNRAAMRAVSSQSVSADDFGSALLPGNIEKTESEARPIVVPASETERVPVGKGGPMMGGSALASEAIATDDLLNPAPPFVQSTARAEGPRSALTARKGAAGELSQFGNEDMTISPGPTRRTPVPLAAGENETTQGGGRPPPDMTETARGDPPRESRAAASERVVRQNTLPKRRPESKPVAPNARPSTPAVRSETAPPRPMAPLSATWENESSLATAAARGGSVVSARPTPWGWAAAGGGAALVCAVIVLQFLAGRAGPHAEPAVPRQMASTSTSARGQLTRPPSDIGARTLLRAVESSAEPARDASRGSEVLASQRIAASMLPPDSARTSPAAEPPARALDDAHSAQPGDATAPAARGEPTREATTAKEDPAARPEGPRAAGSETPRPASAPRPTGARPAGRTKKPAAQPAAKGKSRAVTPPGISWDSN